MYQLPDTNQRLGDLRDDCRMWNETGFKCHCGNVLLVGSKTRLYCGTCGRYWNRDEVEKEVE